MEEEYRISDWEKTIQESSLNEKEKKEKLFFVKKAFENNVPVIFSLEHFSTLVGVKK